MKFSKKKDIWPTKVTEIIPIQYPIIQAPMAGGATTPELVAAVSNAGGLGSLGAGYMTPANIKQAIKKIRELTNKPFAVNLFIPESYQVTSEKMQKACDDINASCPELNIKIEPITEPYSQSFDEQVKILIEEKIPVFSYTFGTLSSTLITQFKKNNTILIGTATTLDEANILEESGIDIIVSQGSEAGGHRGTFLGKTEDALIGLMELLSQLKKNIKLPVIAAGGIMNGEKIIEAINHGAAGVQMGTAFLCCTESGISFAYKQCLLEQQHDNTVLTRAFSGKLARGIRNKFIERMNSKKANILAYPVQNALTNNMRKKAITENNTDFMSLWAGQSAKFCKNITCNALIKTLITEVEER